MTAARSGVDTSYLRCESSAATLALKFLQLDGAASKQCILPCFGERVNYLGQGEPCIPV